MIKITQRPHNFCFSKNPVQYTFDVPNFSYPGCYVQVRIYARTIGGVAALLHEEKIKPLTSTVIYNMSDIVESALDYVMPDFAPSIVQTGQNIKEFYIDFSTITTADPTAFWISDSVNFMYIIKGGIAAPIWDWNNYFINYIPANKPFLTWQPGNRFIGLNDSFFISWLNTSASVTLSLIADVEFTDGTTDQVVTDFTDSDKVLYHLQVGPDQLGLNALDITKSLYKYSLSIVKTSDHATIYASGYIYYIDYRKFYNTKFLHYYNSLGGLECVRVRGEIETDVDVSIADAEKFSDVAVIGAPNSEQYTQTAKSKIDSFKGDSGYIYTSAEQDVFQELLLTRFAWERIIDQNWRIYSLTKSVKLRSTSDKIWNFPIEWRYSFTNSVYTPMLDMGDGEDQYDYCVKVGIPGSPALPDAVVGESYNYQFQITGDPPFSFGTIVKPDWMTITKTDIAVIMTGTPTTDATDVAVSIEITNCTAGTVTFSDTLDVLVFRDYLIKDSYTSTIDAVSGICTFDITFTRTGPAVTQATADGKRIKATYIIDADSGCIYLEEVIFEPTDTSVVKTGIVSPCDGYCSSAVVTIFKVEVIP